MNKNCPICGIKQSYKSKLYFNRAVEKNVMCRSCSHIGQLTWNKNKKDTKIYKINCPNCGKEQIYKQKGHWKRASLENRKCNHCRQFGISLSENHKRIISIKLSGKNNPFYNKKHTELSKEKMRVATLKQKSKLYGGITYNPISCVFINDLNKTFGWNLRHALNEREEWIAGYSLDGYDKENNIVFEYDEPYHNKPKQKKKDLVRQQNIINRINPMMFIRYDERNKRLYDAITDQNI